MRITTWNVNGLRAALKKGFGDCLAQLSPDVLLLQEIRSRPEQLPSLWQQPVGWQVHWRPAEKGGYAGTAIWSRRPLEILETGWDGEPDLDGRILRARVGELELVCVYLPSGSASPERQEIKEAWMARFLPWTRQWVQSDRPVLMGGDLNIARTPRDIYYAKSNANKSGFLPHERAWFEELLDGGWTDFVRLHYGDVDGPYTWWSNRGEARAKDRGWRIDYLLGNPAAHRLWTDAHVYRPGGLTVSDHAPVTVNLRHP